MFASVVVCCLCVSLSLFLSAETWLADCRPWSSACLPSCLPYCVYLHEYLFFDAVCITNEANVQRCWTVYIKNLCILAVMSTIFFLQSHRLSFLFIAITQMGKKKTHKHIFWNFHNKLKSLAVNWLQLELNSQRPTIINEHVFHWKILNFVFNSCK